MASPKRKPTVPDKSGDDRTVYREFPSASSPEALEPGKPPAKKSNPQAQTLRVQATRKGKGGKTVTTITGFQEDAETLATLLKQLKNHCATGGTVRDGELDLQGDHRPKIVQFLQKLGYPAKISGG